MTIVVMANFKRLSLYTAQRGIRVLKKKKNIKSEKRYRDGVPKCIETR